MILAPFFRYAGGLQSTNGVEFPSIKCWIIKTILRRTRQKSYLFYVYIISHFLKKIKCFFEFYETDYRESLKTVTRFVIQSIFYPFNSAFTASNSLIMSSEGAGVARETTIFTINATTNAGRSS